MNRIFCDTRTEDRGGGIGHSSSLILTNMMKKKVHKPYFVSILQKVKRRDCPTICSFAKSHILDESVVSKLLGVPR